MLGQLVQNHYRALENNELSNSNRTLELLGRNLNLWKEHIDSSVVTQIDAKTKLQEYSLKLFKNLPIYRLISNTGPRHKPLFKVSVKLKDTKFFTAQGSSKKEAEQNAATLCLKVIDKK